jgi:hypothetical protein
MIILETSNCAFSDDCSGGNSLANQLNNVKSTTFLDIVNSDLLLDDMVGIFEAFDFNEFFVCWVQILKIDRLINLLVRIF